MLRREIPAATFAILATGLLGFLVIAGSRGLKDFDSALVGYAVALLVAFAALAYRYTLWITRPPTWRYFRGGWLNFLSFRNFLRYAALVPVALWRDIFGQTFLLKRSRSRWLSHMLIFWGVLLSLFITVPLTFGWIRFSLVEPDSYQLWFFGLAVFRFPIEAGTGFAIFHALDITAVMLILGVTMALWRRSTDLGLRTTQRLGFDLLPLLLLFGISVTGLALTGSSAWWGGRFYWFISLVHQATVVAWVLVIPFGKLFHIIQRPASVGVTLYQTVNQNLEGGETGVEPKACRRCSRPFPSAQFVKDLEASLQDLEQRYALGGDRGSLLDYCPSCKRALRATAYYQLLGKRLL